LGHSTAWTIRNVRLVALAGKIPFQSPTQVDPDCSFKNKKGRLLSLPFSMPAPHNPHA
jgi:hypothetical protein